jgi:hypothetical protein
VESTFWDALPSLPDIVAFDDRIGQRGHRPPNILPVKGGHKGSAAIIGAQIASGPMTGRWFRVANPHGGAGRQ